MVVDDEPLLVQIARRRLESQGYAVTATSNSREALEQLLHEPNRFDVLITDQTMPGITGVELAKAALRVNPSLSIILCTGHCEVISKENALALGIKKYISKPVRGDELLDSVKEVLNHLK